MSHPPLDNPGPGNGSDLTELILLTVIVFLVLGVIYLALTS